MYQGMHSHAHLKLLAPVGAMSLLLSGCNVTEMSAHSSDWDRHYTVSPTQTCGEDEMNCP